MSSHSPSKSTITHLEAAQFYMHDHQFGAQIDLEAGRLTEQTGITHEFAVDLLLQRVCLSIDLPESDNRSKSQRYSDNIAEFCGSWGFVTWFSVIVVIWVLFNTTWLVFGRKFDEYPFILLNLFLTVISTMQSPIIMMAQNRQVERDRETIKGLHQKLDALMIEMIKVEAQQ